ncbi:hypothetical protein ACVWW2_005617 [Bradyrhizobium sp. LM4.3]
MKTATAQVAPSLDISSSMATGSAVPATSPVVIPSHRPPQRKSSPRALTWITPSIEPNKSACAGASPSARNNSIMMAPMPKLTKALSVIAATTRLKVLLGIAGGGEDFSGPPPASPAIFRRGARNAKSGRLMTSIIAA